MNTVKLTMTAILCLVFSATLSTTFSTGQRSALAANDCTQARKDYVTAQQDWSTMNAELGAMRQELEVARNLRWDIKATLAVLDDTLEILKKEKNLSDAQRITLNSRIPHNLGEIDPDGAFVTGLVENGPLKIDQARDELKDLLTQTEEDISGTEKDLENMERESHALSRKLRVLEEAVEKECEAANMPTPWHEGVPRVSADEIYRRYTERESRRQEEVVSRRWADIDRLYAHKYRPYHYRPYQHYPGYPGYHYPPYPDPYHYYYPQLYGSHYTRALLIELSSADKELSCLRCYPYKSSSEKRRILKGLDRAVDHHEFIPCTGTLGAYKVIKAYDDISSCYDKLY